MALTFWQRLRLRLGGAVYLEHRTKPGWRGSLPFYAVKCPTHGIVESRPHGFEGWLLCPECLREEYPSFSPQIEVEEETPLEHS